MKALTEIIADKKKYLTICSPRAAPYVRKEIDILCEYLIYLNRVEKERDYVIQKYLDLFEMFEQDQALITILIQSFTHQF